MKVDAVLRAKGNRIVCVGMTASVERAAHLLKAENIGAVVVKDTCGTEGDVVLGMLSERDIVRALADHGPACLRMPVSAVMSRAVVSCQPRDDVDDVIDKMRAHQIRHVPVLDGDALIGIVSIRDVMAAPALPA